MQTPTDPFLLEVEDFLEKASISAWRFGTEVMGDPTFVFELRKGRSVYSRTIRRVREQMSHFVETGSFKPRRSDVAA